MAAWALGESRKKLRSVARWIFGGDAKPKDGLLSEINAIVMGGEHQEDECYPDNWQAYQAFSALRTQWMVGPGGVIGLRYESIPVVFEKRLGIKQEQHGELMQLIAIMEDEALTLFRGSSGN